MQFRLENSAQKPYHMVIPDISSLSLSRESIHGRASCLPSPTLWRLCTTQETVFLETTSNRSKLPIFHPREVFAGKCFLPLSLCFPASPSHPEAHCANNFFFLIFRVCLASQDGGNAPAFQNLASLSCVPSVRLICSYRFTPRVHPHCERLCGAAAFSLSLRAKNAFHRRPAASLYEFR
jgi:hypothetical protein